MRSRPRGRLMIISVSDAPPGSLTAWDALHTSLSQMSTHAYLPWSAQERALALLREVAVVARRTRGAGRHALAVCAAAASHDVVAVIVSGTFPCPVGGVRVLGSVHGPVSVCLPARPPTRLFVISGAAPGAMNGACQRCSACRYSSCFACADWLCVLPQMWWQCSSMRR